MPEQRNLLLTIRYQGTNYHGFQVQKNAVTVAQVLQDALESVLDAREDIKGCSRTDSGVHANMFCVSVKTNSKIPCQSLIRALNVKLPYDIAVTDCREVPLDFHARYDCKGKGISIRSTTARSKTRLPTVYSTIIAIRSMWKNVIANANILLVLTTFPLSVQQTARWKIMCGPSQTAA